MITNTKYIKIPIAIYAKMQAYLNMLECDPDEYKHNPKIQAIKILRSSDTNRINDEELYFSLKKCRQIVDWIIANPNRVFISTEAVLIPASILK